MFFLTMQDDMTFAIDADGVEVVDDVLVFSDDGNIVHQEFVEDVATMEVVDEDDLEFEVDEVADALDVLDEHFVNHGGARLALMVLHDIADAE